jgi:hypothetical protein
MLITVVLGELRRSIIFNLFCFIFVITLSFVVVWVFAIQLFHNYWYSLFAAITWVVIMLIIGIFYRAKKYYEEWRTFETPWEVNSASSYVMRARVLEVTGMAYIASEVFMGAAGCLLKSIDGIKKYRMLASLNQETVKTALTPLAKSAINGQRFIDLNQTLINHELLTPFVSADIVWLKQEKEYIAIGINRKYEKLV